MNSNAQTLILFREVAGAGIDEEASTPDGVVVQLSYWDVETFSFILRPHYLLETFVMLDREIISESHKYILGTGWRRTVTDPMYIREAIKVFDETVASHPTLSKQAEAEDNSDIDPKLLFDTLKPETTK